MHPDDFETIAEGIYCFDDSGHIYIVPMEKYERFYALLEKGTTYALMELDELFTPYKMNQPLSGKYVVVKQEKAG